MKFARLVLSTLVLAALLTACGGSDDASSFDEPKAREDFLIGCLEPGEDGEAPGFIDGELQSPGRFSDDDMAFCECAYDGVSSALLAEAETFLNNESTDEVRPEEIDREAFNRYRELNNALGEFPEILNDDLSDAAKARLEGTDSTRTALRKSVEIQADEVGRCRAEFLL